MQKRSQRMTRAGSKKNDLAVCINKVIHPLLVKVAYYTVVTIVFEISSLYGLLIWIYTKPN